MFSWKRTFVFHGRFTEKILDLNINISSSSWIVLKVELSAYFTAQCLFLHFFLSLRGIKCEQIKAHCSVLHQKNRNNTTAKETAVIYSLYTSSYVHRHQSDFPRSSADIFLQAFSRVISVIQWIQFPSWPAFLLLVSWRVVCLCRVCLMMIC